MEQAKRYMTSDEVRDKMQQVVGVPEVNDLEEMYTVRRSAAD